MPRIYSLILASFFALIRVSFGYISNCSFEGYPDLHFVHADLFTPNASESWGPTGPQAGKRVNEVLPSWRIDKHDEGNEKVREDGEESGVKIWRTRSSEGRGAKADNDRHSTPWEPVHHSIYLPLDWVSTRQKKYPVIVEFTGNGPWQDDYNDVSTGLPEKANMGYGISGGVGYVWLSLPFLDLSGQFVQTYWWGCPVNSTKPVGQCPGYYDQNKTLLYMKEAVRWVSETYNGDVDKIFITGWSRGALATNYFGLFDDEAASLFRGFLPYSHFDGQPSDSHLPYPYSDPQSALERLKRLNGKPMFITCERNGTVETEAFLNSTGLILNTTFMSTGFCNHNDQWTLRPSSARTAMREWLSSLI